MDELRCSKDHLLKLMVLQFQAAASCAMQAQESMQTSGKVITPWKSGVTSTCMPWVQEELLHTSIRCWFASVRRTAMAWKAAFCQSGGTAGAFTNDQNAPACHRRHQEPR